MNKEELIKLLENIELTEIVGFNLIYFNEEEDRYNSCDNRDLRTINYNFDIKHELENIRRNIDCNYENIHRDINYMIDEKLNERGVK